MAGERVPEKITSSTIFVETTATLCLEVTNYLQLTGMGVSKFVSSPALRVGGYEWRIDFFPDGENEDCAGNASAFLTYLSQDVDVSTKFRMRMLEKKGRLPPVASFDVSKRVFSSGPYKDDSWGHYKFVDKAKLESLSQLGDGCFTVLCDVTVIHDSLPVELPFHLERVLGDGRGTDVTFHVCRQKFHAHSPLLAARSPVFEAQLYGPMADKDMGRVKIVGVKPFIFETMLHYIYTDSLPPCPDEGGYSAAAMQHLLVAADRYGLDRLKLICEEDLCKRIDAETIATMLALADQHHCKRLKDACQELFPAAARGRTRGKRVNSAPTPIVTTKLRRGLRSDAKLRRVLRSDKEGYVEMALP
ncbi:BTB/POZ and MATH domain-containing protein 1-like [Aegilops tauschii subsp. strangulata]|uniref:Speckle-type POZ protein-like protein n=1 Tax=Aegilops tauschii TaxID=37682 RepID=M8CNK8_AEGTA|nr:BTB/POZ and MATH domain-containing protein 1-like [Aegilops tauschii subsp. strangulata]